MISKVFICPYFGVHPEWMDNYWRNAERMQAHGYNFLLEDDEDAFRDRVRDRLGIEPPPMWGTGNIWDFRPALGFLYEDKIADYDFWGHTDFDCVYGRVERFTTDERLHACDIFSDCAHNYIAGPWSLYRNHRDIRELFLQHPLWEHNMTYPVPTGWVETTFTAWIRDAVSVTIVDEHGYDQPELLLFQGDRLMHGGREIPMFHFRRSKQYPKGCVR